MGKSTKEKNISRIVKMEERIYGCSRCKEVRTCCHKPSTGKGDIESDILLVFPHESDLTRDRAEMSRVRNEIAVMAGKGRKVYHTYMVRCQPKICNRRKDQAVLFDGVLINGEGRCLLSRLPCDGQIAEPDDQQNMNCLHFLLEEIEILAPELIITVGERTYQYVFRAFGLFDPFQKSFSKVRNRLFRSSEYLFVTADLPELGSPSPFSELSRVLQVIPPRRAHH